LKHTKAQTLELYLNTSLHSSSLARVAPLPEASTNIASSVYVAKWTKKGDYFHC